MVLPGFDRLYVVDGGVGFGGLQMVLGGFGWLYVAGMFWLVVLVGSGLVGFLGGLEDLIRPAHARVHQLVTASPHSPSHPSTRHFTHHPQRRDICATSTRVAPRRALARTHMAGAVNHSPLKWKCTSVQP